MKSSCNYNVSLSRHLSEKEGTEIFKMISFGDRVRTQQELCNLFIENNPYRPAITRCTKLNQNLGNTASLEIYLKEEHQVF